MFVFYYDMYSFKRAIPPCLENISCHMSVNRDQLAIIVVIDCCCLGEWVKVFNDTFCIVHPAFDLQLLLTPLVSSTFSFNSISVIYCRSVLLFVFYYDMYSFTRAIPPCLENISCHMSVNRDQLAIIAKQGGMARVKEYMS
jgi:hypothetical protein